jgi:hypothetical protein
LKVRPFAERVSAIRARLRVRTSITKNKLELATEIRSSQIGQVQSERRIGANDFQSRGFSYFQSSKALEVAEVFEVFEVFEVLKIST